MNRIMVWGLPFLAPFLVAAVLYPLMRRYKKPWTFLILFTGLFSYFGLIVKEIFGNSAAIGVETYLNALLILLGLTALTALFGVNANRLRAEPRIETFLRNYRLRRNVHLRHILQVAVVIEKHGRSLYQKLGAILSDEQARQLCRFLADAELAHQRYIEAALGRWLSFPVRREGLALFKEEVSFREIFLKPPPPGASEKEIFKYALEQEEKTAQFYRSFEGAFPQAWKRMYIQRLAEEETEHAEKLRELSPRIKG